MGLVTLLIFPIPAFIALHFFENKSFTDFLDLDSINLFSILSGCGIGFVYACIAHLILGFPIFKTVPLRVDELVRSMNLRFIDALFLSLCAGIGEELLFRAGIQFYLGPIITSVLFVALHGYLNPLNWRQSLYGIVVLPLSFILGYGYELYGLWFAIAAHSSYDFVLFLSMRRE
jgi:membrane protease YdiL (CAAX protease family)